MAIEVHNIFMRTIVKIAIIKDRHVNKNLSA